jgi:predicted dehydrogenase
VDDLATAFIRFETGASLTLETSWASNSEKREEQWTQWFGTDGGAVMRNLHESYEYEARLFVERDGEVVAEEPPPISDGETPQRHFCRSILSGTPPAATGEQGLTVMRILDGIYRSARTGREVRL